MLLLFYAAHSNATKLRRKAVTFAADKKIDCYE